MVSEESRPYKGIMYKRGGIENIPVLEKLEH
jgi:hypothetical protein